MNTHPGDRHTLRRKRHMFDPSRVKISVPQRLQPENRPDGGVLIKRQWHAPWSLAVSLLYIRGPTCTYHTSFRDRPNRPRTRRRPIKQVR